MAPSPLGQGGWSHGEISKSYGSPPLGQGWKFGGAPPPLAVGGTRRLDKIVPKSASKTPKIDPKSPSKTYMETEPQKYLKIYILRSFLHVEN